MTIQAPFPWFGGKSRAAAEIWAALGDPPNYVEPFAGSLAVLLGRPDSPLRWTETVNDADGFICNFWRAVAADPTAVAAHADWPVNECDLSARHLWLVERRSQVTERLQVDPDYFDPKIAGWWVWGACSWIGSGWCSGEGPWGTDGEHWVDLGDKGRGINRKLPHLGDKGQGINRQLPHLGNKGQGINRQLPHLGNKGRGINRKLPHLGDKGRGAVLDWFDALATRLRGVRVACGDWRRVLGDSVTTRHGTTGVLLDPPYPDGFGADGGAYASGCSGVDVWHQAATWAAEAGDTLDLRIVLCGYAGTWTPPEGWREMPWKARGGYGSTAENGNDNCHRERLWLSPGCLGARQSSLF